MKNAKKWAIIGFVCLLLGAIILLATFASAGFDIFIVLAISCNLIATLLSTFEEATPYMQVIHAVEFVTIIIFVIEYILRLWTAEYLYPDSEREVIMR